MDGLRETSGEQGEGHVYTLFKDHMEWHYVKMS